MPTLSVPVAAARDGVKVATNRLTTIQIRLASLEVLVGGPYADHRYGHTALRVTTATDDRVYDYGRYGRTWGVGDSEGDGVLNVWTDFNAYIANENSYGRITTGFVYDATEEKAKEAHAFFEQRIKGQRPKSSGRIRKTYVIEDYHALGPNCTTLSVEAAKRALPDLDREWATHQKGRGLNMFEKGLVSARGWPQHIFMPADLQSMLESSAVRRPKSINRYGKSK